MNTPSYDPSRHPHDRSGRFGREQSSGGKANTTPSATRPEPPAVKRAHATVPVKLAGRIRLGGSTVPLPGA